MGGSEDGGSCNLLQVLFEGAAAGGAAGVVVETALYPIDTIKTRLQAAQGGNKIQWKGLYAGLGGNIVGVLPASAIFVGVYEPAKRKLLEMFPENLSAIAHLTAGAIGGAASSLIRVPTEVVKQRMQMSQFKTAPDAVRLIVAKEGIKGLYAGYGSFLLRDLPFDAIQFCIYEQLRIGYRLAAKRDLKDAENAIIGAFADIWYPINIYEEQSPYNFYLLSVETPKLHEKRHKKNSRLTSQCALPASEILRCLYWRFNNAPRCHEDKIDDSGTGKPI
ncbi:hypothetical protein SETIT_2G108400v2 [Setaria italica]|uniref:Uncharacterized protein n=1 Tax=Setaria italica TaxID=4555 RepID=A0A368PX74_SETIT|nr:hypothetical protein SETIT_2G108400v2 [Setaria italica]